MFWRPCRCRWKRFESLMERDHNKTTIFTLPFIRIILLIILVMLIIRQNYLPAGLIIFVLLLVSLSRLWCKLALRELVLESSIFPCRLFPEETATLKIAVNNKKRLPILIKWQQQLLPEIQLAVTAAAEAKQAAIIEDPKILGGFKATGALYELVALKRGFYRLPPLIFIAQDVPGLFENNTTLDNPMIMVYPRIRTLPELELKPADLIGDRRDKRPLMPDPIRIAGLRDYTPDIPARFINWKASAHKDELLAKILEPSTDLRICLVVDVESFVWPTKEEQAFEEALTLAASLAFWAEGSKIPFALLANGRQKELDCSAVVSMSGAPNHIATVLEALARLELAPQDRLSDLLRLERENLPWGTTMVIIARGEETVLEPSFSNSIYFNISGEAKQ
ncbi:MAG: DUF58 domain-containing protein [Desulfocucumaceae bacterium]